MKALNNDSSMKLKPRSEHGTDCKFRDAVQFLMYNQTHKQGMKGQNSCSGTSCSGHHRLGDATSSCNKSNGFCHPEILHCQLWISGKTPLKQWSTSELHARLLVGREFNFSYISGLGAVSKRGRMRDLPPPIQTFRLHLHKHPMDSYGWTHASNSTQLHRIKQVSRHHWQCDRCQLHSKWIERVMQRKPSVQV